MVKKQNLKFRRRRKFLPRRIGKVAADSFRPARPRDLKRQFIPMLMRTFKNGGLCASGIKRASVLDCADLAAPWAARTFTTFYVVARGGRN
jgi:hypothetical protein